MVVTARVAEIFSDARDMHAAALERLDAGDIRDAADKAWCATKRASDALVLARTGEEPELSPVTSRELRNLAGQDDRVEGLLPRYFTRQVMLHGECFYLGLCDPASITERRIRETADYIDDAEALAA